MLLFLKHEENYFNLGHFLLKSLNRSIVLHIKWISMVELMNLLLTVLWFIVKSLNKNFRVIKELHAQTHPKDAQYRPPPHSLAETCKHHQRPTKTKKQQTTKDCDQYNQTTLLPDTRSDLILISRCVS